RSSAGLDKSVSDGDFKAMRNLCNKLWNASRFILLNTKEHLGEKAKKCPNDQVFQTKMTQLTQEITKNLNAFQIGVAADTLYNEFWHWFCDQSIEESKKDLINSDLLLDGLQVFLKLFHPFMPFVTEAIWQELVKEKLVEEKVLASSTWPT
ncbi:MAG TPA: class I tRNA ligase family protein, partial [Candidatus Woesebacteria bacterium]|nr:class I tRNA ligase family protein [Candidatus Woesebacteria bacterium]